jgi:ribosome-associated heat shock protein Hsp15
VDEVRVDQWLWAIRSFKTRTAATEACRGGRIRVNGSAVKPATRLRPGDRVEMGLSRATRVLELVTPIAKRVGPTEAASCYRDLTPPPARDHEGSLVRDRGAGRPTKADRRALERAGASRRKR